MDTLSVIGRVILVIVNIFFLITSLLMMVTGFFLRFGQPLVDTYLLPQVEETIASLKTELGIDVSETAFKLSQVQDVAIAFILLGLCLLILSSFGCCGACCQVKWMLIAYIVVLSAIIATQLILVFLLVSDQGIVDDVIRKPMKSALQTFYTGFTGLDPLTLTWNAIMAELKCCGVDSWKDFEDAAVWNNIYQYTISGIGITTLTLDFPLTCCELDGPYPGGKPVDVTACMLRLPTFANIDQGCFAAINNELKSAGAVRSIIMGVGISVLVIEILLVFFAAWVIRDIEKKSRVSPSG